MLNLHHNLITHHLARHCYRLHLTLNHVNKLLDIPNWWIYSKFASFHEGCIFGVFLTFRPKNTIPRSVLTHFQRVRPCQKYVQTNRQRSAPKRCDVSFCGVTNRPGDGIAQRAGPGVTRSIDAVV